MNITYKEKKIIITGVRGYIGNELKHFFNKKKCHIVSTKNYDLSIKKNWNKIISKDIDYIFHLAAVEETGKDLSMNSNSTLFMLETCVEKKCYPRIIYASTTNIFGITDNKKINEKSKSTPLSNFSAQKFLSENYLKYFYNNHNINSIILRIPNVYGPVRNKKNFNRVVLNRIIDTALKTNNINLYSNKNCLRDFIFIDDVINAFYVSGLINKKFCNGDFYIISSKNGLTLKQVFLIIKNNIKSLKMNNDKKTKLGPMENRSQIIQTNAYSKISGWKCKVSLIEGIKLTIKSIS